MLRTHHVSFLRLSPCSRFVLPVQFGRPATALAMVAGLFVMIGFGDIAAASPKIVRGGPNASSQNVLSSLRGQVAAMSVCWQGKRPKAVEIAVSVAKNGTVVKAQQKTAGPAAQCAAGILAVHSFPKTGKSYSMTVSIPTKPMDVGQLIQAELASHRDTLNQCYLDKGNAGSKGTVGLQFTITTSGRIQNATVAKTSLKHKPTESCLVKTIETLSIAPPPGGKPVKYALSLAFDPSLRERSSTSNANPPTANVKPEKDGPVSSHEIQTAMEKIRGVVNKCYTSQLRKNPKLGTGYVMLRFTIYDDGKTHNVKVKASTLNHGKTESCLIKTVEKVRFSKEAGRKPTRVFYPFHFSR